MNDYEQAKSISTELGLNKQKTITPENISNFRRYLSLVAMKANRKYVTKLLNGNVLVIRVR